MSNRKEINGPLQFLGFQSVNMTSAMLACNLDA
jgi:hypothetical protein